MSSLEPLPCFVNDYYNVDVPEPYRTDYPTPDETYQKREDYFNRVSASLDLSFLALSVVMKERDEVSFHGMSSFKRQLWFDDIQPLAGFSGRRLDKNSQIIQFSKYRLKPETIDAILQVQSADKIIGQ